MSALPSIRFSFWAFIPDSLNGTKYRLDAVTPNSCEMFIDNGSTREKANVDPSTKFPIDRDIEILNRQELGITISAILAVVASFFLTYLIVKENYGPSMSKVGGFYLLTSCSFLYGSWQHSKKCFEIANKVICTHEGRDVLYAYSSYRVIEQHTQIR